MRPIVILDVFPQHFNVNGDCGNVLCLCRRLEWAGIPVEVVNLAPHERWPKTAPDIVHIGGGSLAAQAAVLPELVTRRSQFQEWVDSGVPVLAVAGGFQLAMDSVELTQGRHQKALGIFSGMSLRVEERISSFAVVTVSDELVFGYQNLGQSVRLAEGQAPLGELVYGLGNVFTIDTEGAIRANAIGSNLHGPLLPKNPSLADRLIATAVARRGEGRYELGERHNKADYYATKGNETIMDRLELARAKP